MDSNDTLPPPPAEQMVALGFTRHKYRQGTGEGIAFNRGFRAAEELAAASRAEVERLNQELAELTVRDAVEGKTLAATRAELAVAQAREVPADWRDTIQGAIDELPYAHPLIPRLTLLLEAKPKIARWTDAQVAAVEAEGARLHEKIAASPQPADRPTEPAPIRCPEKLKSGGSCPHHNLQCGWPQCNEERKP